MHPVPPSSRMLLAVFALYGLWGGWTLPGSQEGDQFPIGTLGILLALAPGVGFVAASLLGKQWHVKSGTRLQALLDRLLGKGTHHFLFERAGIALMLGLSATLIGAVGITRSLLLGAASSYSLLSTFFLSAGIGMLFIFVAATRQRLNPGSTASDA